MVGPRFVIRDSCGAYVKSGERLELESLNS